MRLRNQRGPVVAACLAIFALASCSPPPTTSKRCLTGLASCSGSCVDLQTDHGNCGACGAGCALGERCQAGVCTPSCADSLTSCGVGEVATCVDTDTDVQNCGACGTACTGRETCTLGVCHLGCAAPGWATCGARCSDLKNDPSHCGDCAMACGDGQICASGFCVATSAATQPRVIVSITADDTFADQFTDMAPALEAHGMRATFFVSTGRIDVPGVGYLTSAQLNAMQAVGHEIGSHGLTHQHLVTTVNLHGQISREVCDSRVELLSRGYDVRAIAYPYGEVDGLAQLEAQRCGYAMGRMVGAISSTYADTVPPINRFELRAASSVNSAKTLDVVEQLVLDAEAHASGTSPSWLVLNFHHICPGATCNPALAWDTDLFKQLTAWLAARKEQGTVVRTLSQVAGGTLEPPVSSGSSLVLNGDFESYLAGEDQPPDCWTHGGSGSNTFAWSRVAGRTGYAQQVVMSAFTSGSRILLQSRGSTHNPDYKSYGTPVVPGHTYTFSCWYRSDVRVAFSFYKNEDVTHLATGWMTSPTSPPNPSGWALKTFDVIIPEHFNTVFFGPYISSVCSFDCLNGDGTATLLVDDCNVVDQDD